MGHILYTCRLLAGSWCLWVMSQGGHIIFWLLQSWSDGDWALTCQVSLMKGRIFFLGFVCFQRHQNGLCSLEVVVCLTGRSRCLTGPKNDFDNKTDLQTTVSAQRGFVLFVFLFFLKNTLKTSYGWKICRRNRRNLNRTSGLRFIHAFESLLSLRSID